jgi:hypothetical protein
MAAEVCIANIGAKGILQRRRIGLIAFAIGAALSIVLVAAGVPPLGRAPVLLLFLLAAFGWFQARDKT